MITSYLMGGLGNTLFQISAALSVAYKTNRNTGFSFTDHFLPLQGKKSNNYSDNILSRINLTQESFLNKNFLLYEEPCFSYREIPTRFDNLILKGYFQSEKYFQEYEEKIKNIFSEDEKTRKYIDEKFSFISFNESTSMHIRRGDYLKFSDTHPICDLKYYIESMSIIGKTKNILVFSDDIEWCKNNLPFDNIMFIEGEKDYIDLYLMSRCCNNIIANSSFSWWAAWLNGNKNKKVVAPMKWFGKNGPSDTQDLIPGSWIKI